MLGVARGSEIDVDLCDLHEEEKARYISERLAEPEEIRFQRDSDRWRGICMRDEESPFNHYDLTLITTKLRNEVAGDPEAEEAMGIFIESDYWRFVDYCMEHLRSMNEVNNQKFREALILLAPVLESTRYKAKVVSLVCKNQKEIRAIDMRYVPFCLDMFFYGAVRNGQLGRQALASMCESAFDAPCLNWGKDERFNAYNIRQAIFEGVLYEDTGVRYFIEDIWPNWE
jgi:hypothetical protein